MVEQQNISYDKIDPLEHEKLFFIDENDKVYRKFQDKEKKFPFIHITLFAIFIPLISLMMGMIYIGGLWNPHKLVDDLQYVVVNSDKGCYDITCEKMGLDFRTNLGSLYKKLSGKGGRFTIVQGDKESAIELVENHEYWAAYYVPENFTVNIIKNLNIVNNSNYTTVSVDFIYDEVRSYTTMNFIKKSIFDLEKTYFNNLIEKFRDNGNFNPLFIIQGINYEENNLHEVTGFGQNFSTFITLIIIWIGTIATAIISHFYFPFEDHWILKRDTKHPIMKAIIAKIIFSLIIVGVINVITSVIPFFCGEFEIEHGYKTFYLFIFFFSLSGLGINNLLIHLFPFVSFYLIAVTFMFLQFLSCGGLLDNDVQYNFFRIGRAFPMFYGVREIKYLYWNSGSQYEKQNFTMIGIWAVFSLIAAIFLYSLEIKIKRRRWLKNFDYSETDKQF